MTFFFSTLFYLVAVIILCGLSFWLGLYVADELRPEGDWVLFEEDMIFRKKL